MKGHNIKYDEKTHGYRETELNMRQILLDAERNPNNMPAGKGRVVMDMDCQMNDMDVKKPPDPVEPGPYTGIANYSGFSADVTAQWNPSSHPFGGYPQSN
jgi:hypothetical protein